MSSIGTNLNPLPQGVAWIDLKTGAPTSEFFWFLNQLLQQAGNSENFQITNVFESQGTPAANDPTVQAITKALAFPQGQSPSAAEVSAINALQRAASFAAQTSDALQRVTAVERALAFRPQPPVSVQGVPLIPYTQAQYATAYAAGLGSSPLFIYVSDYAHFIFWNGTAAVFADGGNNFIAAFENDPPGPGWHLMDGSTVNYLNTDGTVTGITLEDLTSVAGNAAYLKLGSPNSGPNAAVAPTISGVTEETTVGFTGSPASAATASINSAAVGTPTNVLIPPISGGGGALTTDPHNHALLAADAPITATGEPRNLERRPFFRQ